MPRSTASPKFLVRGIAGATTLAKRGIFPRIVAHRSRRFTTHDVALLAQGGRRWAAPLLVSRGRPIDIAVFFRVLVDAPTTVAT